MPCKVNECTTDWLSVIQLYLYSLWTMKTLIFLTCETKGKRILSIRQCLSAQINLLYNNGPNRKHSFSYFLALFSFIVSSIFSTSSSPLLTTQGWRDERGDRCQVGQVRKWREWRESTDLPLPARCCLTVCRILSSLPAGCSCSCPLPWQCHASANRDKKLWERTFTRICYCFT